MTTLSARTGPSAPARPDGAAGRTPDTPPRSRLRTLDGLRFLAAAGVVVYHWTARESTAWGEASGDQLPAVGSVAIYFSLAPELFFVISGFVILWTAWGRSVPAVVASRVARLYPAYWAALALTGFLLLVLWPQGKDVSLGQVLVNATLLQSVMGVDHVDGVYWTLWAELRFYLLVVLLVAVGLTRRRVLAFAAVWPVVAVVAARQDWSLLDTLTVGQYAPFFAGGMALFLVWRDGHALVPWLVVVGNAALGVWSAALGKGSTLDRTTAFDADPVVLALVSVGCFAAVAVAALTPLARFDRPWLTSVGALTYPLYLVHLFWGWWVIDLVEPHVPAAVAVLLAAAVSPALAAAIHHGVERRLNPPLRRAVEQGLTAVAQRLPRSRRRSSAGSAD
ncbi:acyltransferase family protein [Cellulomonas marina]|uniref:acyltransferase family protein n=1 Tax=Cellulomonas marina TaxID=988821 RepID=UPI0015872AC1|nr:acyltransferase [Cellulomonas marina]